MSEDFSAWVGRRETAEDVIAPEHVANLAATLDRRPAPRLGETLPPSWHWAFFNRFAYPDEVGPDGHTKRGGFLPPVALPRRMWAGGRLEFPADLPVGAGVRRESEILSVKIKSGRSGALCFVTVRHRIAAHGVEAIVEEHDIVYRDAPQPGAAPPPEPAPQGAEWTRTILPDALLLFRYSALTLNGHRIHYDQDYVRNVEGYPGLIVHGPLIATLLLDLIHRRAAQYRVTRFAFRAVGPLFADAPFTVNAKADGDGLALWAANANGALAMTASAVLE
jgi:3-methylfumaryl-CoA hydratase